MEQRNTTEAVPWVTGARTAGEITPLDIDLGLPARIQERIRAARQYAEAARAPNTLRAYAADVKDFETYCDVEAGGISALPAPPEVVALYITDLVHARGLKTSTVQRRLASISAWHKRAGYSSPTDEILCGDPLYGIGDRRTGVVR